MPNLCYAGYADSNHTAALRSAILNRQTKVRVFSSCCESQLTGYGCRIFFGSFVFRLGIHSLRNTKARPCCAELRKWRGMCEHTQQPKNLIRCYKREVNQSTMKSSLALYKLKSHRCSAPGAVFKSRSADEINGVNPTDGSRWMVKVQPTNAMETAANPTDGSRWMVKIQPAPHAELKVGL